MSGTQKKKSSSASDPKTLQTPDNQGSAPWQPHQEYEQMGGRTEQLAPTNNNFCARGPSAIYANSFSPGLIGSSNMYTCAAYEPAYIGAAGSTEPMCDGCGTCNKAWDLTAFGRYWVSPSYSCYNKNTYMPAQIMTNPVSTMSGAPLDARFAYGQTMAIKTNLETALKQEVAKPQVNSLKVKTLADQLQALQNTTQTYGTVMPSGLLPGPDFYGISFGNSGSPFG